MIEIEYFKEDFTAKKFHSLLHWTTWYWSRVSAHIRIVCAYLYACVHASSPKNGHRQVLDKAALKIFFPHYSATSFIFMNNCLSNFDANYILIISKENVGYKWIKNLLIVFYLMRVWYVAINLNFKSLYSFIETSHKKMFLTFEGPSDSYSSRSKSLKLMA